MSVMTFLRRRHRLVTCVVLTVWIVFILAYVQYGFSHQLEKKNVHYGPAGGEMFLLIRLHYTRIIDHNNQMHAFK